MQRFMRALVVTGDGAWIGDGRKGKGGQRNVKGGDQIVTMLLLTRQRRHVDKACPM